MCAAFTATCCAGLCWGWTAAPFLPCAPATDSTAGQSVGLSVAPPLRCTAHCAHCCTRPSSVTDRLATVARCAASKRARAVITSATDTRAPPSDDGLKRRWDSSAGLCCVRSVRLGALHSSRTPPPLPPLHPHSIHPFTVRIWRRLFSPPDSLTRPAAVTAPRRTPLALLPSAVAALTSDSP